jgi:DNA polymerase-3 subunit gamma/tau
LPPLDATAATAAWKQTLAEIGDMTEVYGGKADAVAISGPNRLVVRFRIAYTQALQFCERPDKRQRLEQTLSRIAGRNLRLDFALLQDEPLDNATDSSPAKPPVSRRQRQQELMRHPLVRKASELFDTEIITVLEPPPADDSGSAESGMVGA